MTIDHQCLSGIVIHGSRLLAWFGLQPWVVWSAAFDRRAFAVAGTMVEFADKVFD